MYTEALVLNADLTPHDVVSWKKAWEMLDRGIAYLYSAYEKQIHTVTLSFPWPAVIVLKHLARKRSLRCTREDLFARDFYTCSYCGVQPKTRSGNPNLDALTFDHVIPRAHSVDGQTVISADGRRVPLTGWLNVVTACGPCNRKKANRTPEQAKMPLRVQPKRPSAVEAVFISLRRTHIPNEWKNALPPGSPWRNYWTRTLDSD